MSALLISWERSSTVALEGGDSFLLFFTLNVRGRYAVMKPSASSRTSVTKAWTDGGEPEVCCEASSGCAGSSVGFKARMRTSLPRSGGGGAEPGYGLLLEGGWKTGPAASTPPRPCVAGPPDITTQYVSVGCYVFG